MSTQPSSSASRRAVERPARAGAAADARDAVQQREVHAAQPLGVAQQREGVGQQEVADRGRLRRLQVGVVGREVVGVLGGVTARAPRPRRASASCRSTVPSRATRRSATRNASRRGRPADSQPAASGPMRRSSSASRELNASPERRVPGELVGRDGVELEQARRAAAPPRAGVEAAALDERDGVREVGQRQPVGQAPRVPDLVAVAGLDELRRRAAREPTARPEVARVAHAGSVASPAARARPSLERPDEVGGDPAAVEVAGVRRDDLVVDAALVDPLRVEGDAGRRSRRTRAWGPGRARPRPASAARRRRGRGTRPRPSTRTTSRRWSDGTSSDRSTSSGGK